jgi:hypothetical protein
MISNNYERPVQAADQTSLVRRCKDEMQQHRLWIALGLLLELILSQLFLCLSHKSWLRLERVGHGVLVPKMEMVALF